MSMGIMPPKMAAIAMVKVNNAPSLYITTISLSMYTKCMVPICPSFRGSHCILTKLLGFTYMDLSLEETSSITERMAWSEGCCWAAAVSAERVTPTHTQHITKLTPQPTTKKAYLPGALG